MKLNKNRRIEGLLAVNRPLNVASASACGVKTSRYLLAS